MKRALLLLPLTLLLFGCSTSEEAPSPTPLSAEALGMAPAPDLLVGGQGIPVLERQCSGTPPEVSCTFLPQDPKPIIKATWRKALTLQAEGYAALTLAVTHPDNTTELTRVTNGSFPVSGLEPGTYQVAVSPLNPEEFSDPSALPPAWSFELEVAKK